MAEDAFYTTNYDNNTDQFPEDDPLRHIQTEDELADRRGQKRLQAIDWVHDLIDGIDDADEREKIARTFPTLFIGPLTQERHEDVNTALAENIENYRKPKLSKANKGVHSDLYPAADNTGHPRNSLIVRNLLNDPKIQILTDIENIEQISDTRKKEILIAAIDTMLFALVNGAIISDIRPANIAIRDIDNEDFELIFFDIDVDFQRITIEELRNNYYGGFDDDSEIRAIATNIIGTLYTFREFFYPDKAFESLPVELEDDITEIFINLITGNQINKSSRLEKLTTKLYGLITQTI
ncbi:MAG: hypothetical protein Q9M91_01590 [Candidatus Dojkabacteria bacterium]|nr:hypothetical protein [Candidatus Dojkabacteria bacterium]MDQ7020518.1 hypothetical protein [Candidatus Dojkabacteria bacterium]